MDHCAPRKAAGGPSDDSTSSDGNGEFSYRKFRPKKKRRNDAGRRIQRGVLYCSSLGITCHFCRQKTIQKKVWCRACALAFCGPCLRNRHGEELEIELADDDWLCPKCRGGCGPGCKNCCNCTFCRKKQGLKPPKFSAGELRAHGFDNVHDYLIHLETGESFDRIAARKLGKGWCSTIEKRRPKSEQDSPDSKQKKREVSKEDFGETGIGAVNMCQRGSINAEHHQRLMGELEQNVDAFKCERSMASRAEDMHRIDNHDRKIERPVRIVDENLIYTQNKSQARNTEKSFPKQFRSTNEFREKLEAKLAKPFDAQELNELWDAIKCRKPVYKFSETHQGTSGFVTKELGHSYIQRHPDLVEKYTATREGDVKLKLLRGFFFWLEHASMPGAFKPWKEDDTDEECLELNGPDCQVLGVLLNVEKDQQMSSAVQHVESQEDIKPDVKVAPVEGLASRSKVTFNWDDEDIKPKVDNAKLKEPDITNWRSSIQVQAGRA